MYLRLYYPEDADLILIRLTLGSRFPAFVRNCLKAGVSGKRFPYDPPDAKNGRKLPKMKSSYGVNIALNAEKDADVISFFSKIPDGAGNSIAKKMICMSYERFPSDVFLKVNGIEPEEIIRTDPVEETKPDEEKTAENTHQPQKIKEQKTELDPAVENKTKSVPEPRRKDSTEENTEPESVNIESDDDMMSLLNGMVNHG